MKRDANIYGNRNASRRPRWSASLRKGALAGAVALALLCGAPGMATAYTAAGDRLFPATILLPQVAPSDELYLTGMTQPVSGGRASSLTVNYGKTILERFGIGVSEGYDWLDQTGNRSLDGWQNTALIMQYTPIIDAEHEFLLSIGGEHEFGATGTVHAGAAADGATTSLVYLGKGMGDLGIAALRPISIAGIFGYQLGDTAARPDAWVGGVALEYSIPYFTSKVAATGLPDWLRATTPMVEFMVTTPAQPRHDAATVATLAPGFDYAGNGWELGAEALVPLSRGAGQGLGFALQLHLALDYLFPESIGKPLLEDQ